jgi:hypothetical protein
MGNLVLDMLITLVGCLQRSFRESVFIRLGCESSTFRDCSVASRVLLGIALLQLSLHAAPSVNGKDKRRHFIYGLFCGLLFPRLQRGSLRERSSLIGLEAGECRRL